MADNWLERKLLREQILNDHAADVWQAASAAIQNVCNSFNKSAEPGTTADIERHNGHLLVVSITLRKQTPVYAGSVTRRVTIQFDGRKPNISVTVDDSVAKVFLIEADETHCFIKFGGREVSPDEFSEFALKDALFGKPRSLSMPPEPMGDWS